MSNSKKRWTAILLAMCLMLGRMWLFTPGKCARMPKSVIQETEAQRQAVILNALKLSLNNPLLKDEAQSFSQLINANGLGGLVQHYLEMDFMTNLTEAEKTLRQVFETAMVDGNIGSGGPPYVSATNNEGQWTVVILNGPSGAANGAASPNSAPTTDSEQPGGGAGDIGVTIPSVIMQDGRISQLPATVVGYWDITADRGQTLTFTYNAMPQGATLTVYQYFDGAWHNEASAQGVKIKVTVDRS